MKLLLLTPFTCLFPLAIPLVRMLTVVQLRKQNQCLNFTICGVSSTTEMRTQLDQHVQAKSSLNVTWCKSSHSFSMIRHIANS